MGGVQMGIRRQIGFSLLAAWAVGLVSGVFGSAAYGQRPPVHYFHSANLPPGVVGHGQTLRGGPVAGYFQPVEILVPPGSSVSLVANGEFQPPQKNSVLVGLQVGQVYPLKIMGIPRKEGAEVFPSIEIVNRMYPPPGLERHFPVPIQFTEEELGLALSGRYVLRVIYLEDPQTALPVRDDPAKQRYFDVRSDEDPLQVADRLGRPLAILRMGSRMPEFDGPQGRPGIYSPPFQTLTAPPPVPAPRSGLEPPIGLLPGQPGRNLPRLPETTGAFPRIGRPGM